LNGQEITTEPPYSPPSTAPVVAIPALTTSEQATSVEPKGRLPMVLNSL